MADGGRAGNRPVLLMEIYLNGDIWGVERVYSDDPMLTMPNGVQTLGVTDNNVKMIFIDRFLRGPLLRKVLIHEITHAWMFSYGYSLPVDQEEFVCDFIASNADDIITKADELICTGVCRYAAKYF